MGICFVLFRFGGGGGWEGGSWQFVFILLFFCSKYCMFMLWFFVHLCFNCLCVCAFISVYSCVLLFIPGFSVCLRVCVCVCVCVCVFCKARMFMCVYIQVAACINIHYHQISEGKRCVALHIFMFISINMR